FLPTVMGDGSERAATAAIEMSRAPAGAKFAERNVMECQPGSLRLDIGRPNDLCPFFGLVGDELGEVGGRAPKHRAFVVGSVSAVLMPWLSLSKISAGVVLGRPTPCHELASYPGTNSLTLGTSGSPSHREAVVTASGRSLSPLM